MDGTCEVQDAYFEPEHLKFEDHLGGQRSNVQEPVPFAQDCQPPAPSQ